MENPKQTLMSFTTALERVKDGGSIRREGWLERVGGEFPKVFLKFGIMHKQENVFSEALEMIKAGLLMAREGWNGRGMYVFFVDGSRFIVNREPLNKIFKEGTEIRYRPHLDMRAADGTIGTWTPSATDILSEDWVEVSLVSGSIKQKHMDELDDFLSEDWVEVSLVSGSIKQKHMDELDDFLPPLKTEITIKSSRGGHYFAELLPERTPNGAYCRGCDGKIRFAKTRRGAAIPVSKNADGEWEPHFNLCAKPDECRKPVNPTA